MPYGPTAGRRSSTPYRRGGTSSGGSWAPWVIGAGAAAAIPGFFGKAVSSAKSGVLGGIRTGISKRVDAQLAGAKGLYGTPAGGLQLADHAQQGEMLAAAGSQQAESQGQYLGFLADQNNMRHQWQSRENALDRALTREMMNNGDPQNGHTPDTFLGRQADAYSAGMAAIDRQSGLSERINRYKNRFTNWMQSNFQPGTSTGDIGTTLQGRHYGTRF